MTAEARFVQKGRISLVGMEFFGNPFAGGPGWSTENQIGRLWQRFDAFWKRHKDELQRLTVPGIGYELHLEPETRDDAQTFVVMVGVEARRPGEFPLELSVRTLPACRYAVFTFKGEQIKSGPSVIWSEWMPRSGYEPEHNYLVEVYDEARFKGMENPDSELEFWVPVRPRKP